MNGYRLLASRWRPSRLADVCVGLLLSACLTIHFVGCTGDPPSQRCTSNEECADGTFCNGIETCEPENEAADGFGCVVGVDPCIEQAPICIEDPPTCVQCLTDIDCNDGVYCNGAEVCMNNACQEGEVPCNSESPFCDEDSNACLCLCESDADCDDSQFCNGVETCVDCACAAGENPCADDGVFCNGLESCEEESDGCVHSGDPCIFGNEVACCNEENGECLPILCNCEIEGCQDDGIFCNGEEVCGEDGFCHSSGDPCAGECPVGGGLCDEATQTCLLGSLCETDADCEDDGVFCNGIEHCDDDGCCRSSGDPCIEEDDGDPCTFDYRDECIEELNQCGTSVPLETSQIEFTLACDNLVGSQCGDTLIAGLEFNPQTGTTLPTLQSCDRADGRAGTDYIHADFIGTISTPIAPELVDIEEITIRSLSTSPLTFSVENCTGITSISYRSDPNAGLMTFSNIAQLIQVGFGNSASSVNFMFLESATSSANDALTLYLNAVVGSNATLSLTTATTNGIETLNIESLGTASNFSDVVMNGTTLTTVNISGNAGLTIANSFDAGVTLIDASANTAGVNLKATQGLTVTFAGSAGDDTFVSGVGVDLIDGRAGNDTIEAGASVDVITGNAGADTFRVSSFLATDRDVITDFDDTPTTGDRLNLDSDVATLSGTDNFSSSASLQTHMATGNLTIMATTEVVVVRSNTVANFTDANSLNGVNLLTAIGGSITSPVTDGQFLFAVADASGNVGIYFGDAGTGDVNIATSELALLAVLQSSNVNIADLVYKNFSNGP